ncbi:MAG: hypothetical protein HQL99_14700 [Magnetococcales bacterium]|nr:hypothetical protein [Magnetococcales bacterium]
MANKILPLEKTMSDTSAKRLKKNNASEHKNKNVKKGNRNKSNKNVSAIGTPSAQKDGNTVVQVLE